MNMVSLKNLKKSAVSDKPYHLLVKHSSIEVGRRWWFLDEVYSNECWNDLDFRSKDYLKFLKDEHIARFIKRYSSEEELEIDVLIRYSKDSIVKEI